MRRPEPVRFLPRAFPRSPAPHVFQAGHLQAGGAGPSALLCLSNHRHHKACCRGPLALTSLRRGQMWAMHLKAPAPKWNLCNTVGTPPPHRIHSSAALVGCIWVIHGGRCPGKFNTTHASYSYEFCKARCCPGRARVAHSCLSWLLLLCSHWVDLRLAWCTSSRIITQSFGARTSSNDRRRLRNINRCQCGRRWSGGTS